MRDSLDEALLRQMEKSILLDTVYDERRISEEAMQALLRERCVEALCAISFLPISVEPVNVTLRTMGFDVISPPSSVDLPVMMFSTPGGRPAR